MLLIVAFLMRGEEMFGDVWFFVFFLSSPIPRASFVLLVHDKERRVGSNGVGQRLG
jgi:hypothetical protein